MQNRISRDAEFDFLESYAVGVQDLSIFEDELYRDILRALWMAYCLHQSLHPSDAEYRLDILRLWNSIYGEYGPVDNGDFHDFGSFCVYMGKNLV